MSLHPVNDQLKIKIDPKSRFAGGDEVKGAETGVVVEIPKSMLYVGMHSMALESSFMSPKLTQVLDLFSELIGKRVYWEMLQDRGRRIKEGDDEYVFLKMTDIVAFADDVNEDAYVVDTTGKGGSFNV